jgi:DNA polymerase delta subunit 4
MPPKRRAPGLAAKAQQQSTLAFHGTSNKVTKGGIRSLNAKEQVLSSDLVKKEGKSEVIEIVDEPTTAEAALIDQTKEEVVVEVAQSTPEEDQARTISDAAIEKYWAAKEKQRKASRAHQEDLSLHEKVFREFDMSAQYGVSLAIHGRLLFALIQSAALHRHRTFEALEACAPPQS